jgi:hypothetical protein
MPRPNCDVQGSPAFLQQQKILEPVIGGAGHRNHRTLRQACIRAYSSGVPNILGCIIHLRCGGHPIISAPAFGRLGYGIHIKILTCLLFPTFSCFAPLALIPLTPPWHNAIPVQLHMRNMSAPLNTPLSSLPVSPSAWSGSGEDAHGVSFLPTDKYPNCRYSVIQRCFTGCPPPAGRATSRHRLQMPMSDQHRWLLSPRSWQPPMPPHPAAAPPLLGFRCKPPGAGECWHAAAVATKGDLYFRVRRSGGHESISSSSSSCSTTATSNSRGVVSAAAAEALPPSAAALQQHVRCMQGAR